MRERSVITYQWNLIYIVEWFSENLIYILGDDPFPLPVEGQHSLELLDNSFISELDNDSDFDEWFDIKQNWEFKHSWFLNRAGSFLPVVLFRRVNDEIEIAWSNGSTYSSHGVSFINPTGVKYISFRKFELIITNFIKDFLGNLMLTSKNKSDAIKFRQKIINLIK
ncbi:hypothetical protein [Paenibacillus sp. H1-7]|uniref:hypothetical protein n=1 Tax=Paenibacillus sp. H1-7 TaxID=2282849 RepID=UPI001EF8C5A5|nr:hypothetical protein [Paenibacillus sp. H1-7]